MKRGLSIFALALFACGSSLPECSLDPTPLADEEDSGDLPDSLAGVMQDSFGDKSYQTQQDVRWLSGAQAGSDTVAHFRVSYEGGPINQYQGEMVGSVADCTPRLEGVVRVQVRTEDGLLDESFDGRLIASFFRRGPQVLGELSDLSGTLQLPPGEYLSVEVSVEDTLQVILFSRIAPQGDRLAPTHSGTPLLGWPCTPGEDSRIPCVE